MGKTLHIIPSGNIWPRIVGKWIGEGPDKFEQDLKLRKLQSTASGSLRKFADQFDKIFNNQNKTGA